MLCGTLWRGLFRFGLNYVKNHWHQIPWFKFAVFIACAVMFFIQFINIYDHYKEFNFAISVEEEYRENIVFPGVTICVDSW